MPRHDYYCKKCKVTDERFVNLVDLDMVQYCEKCGEKVDRQFPKIGVTHSDEAPWLSTTTEFLKDGEAETIHRNPVRTRTEYNKLLKEKGLIPVG